MSLPKQEEKSSSGSALYTVVNSGNAPEKVAKYRKEEAKKGGDAVRAGTNRIGNDVVATALNTLDLPRRVVASATNNDYNLKQALNVVGVQPYKSVVGDEYAARHPYVAMGADIGAGLLA